MESKEAHRGVLASIGWMVCTTFLLVSVTGIIRYIGTDIPAPQAAFIRYSMGLLILTPLFRVVLRNRPPRQMLLLYVARGVLHSCGVVLWFFAMARIPIAEVTALGYATPIFVTIGAAFFLGEKLQMRRITAILVAFAGTAIILRPGFEEISSGQLAQLMAAPLFAGSYLIAKRLTRDGHPLTIVAMLTICTTLFLLPGAILNWVTPEIGDVLWLALAAMFATGSHYTMTRAMRAAPLSVTQPIAFLQLIWATILGIVAFGEAIDPFVLLGGGIVVGAVSFISHREARAARRPITPPEGATKS